MAFIGQDEEHTDALTEIQNKMTQIQQVAQHRDEVFEGAEGKQWNVIAMGAAIAFSIYYFLIRR